MTYCKRLIVCVLLYSKGTRHLWSVPVLSYQDVTYHFRVSLSVSKLRNMWMWTALLLDSSTVIQQFSSSDHYKQFSPNSNWNWLMMCLLVCVSLTEWSELCHWSRNLRVLWLPLSHPKQLCVRRKTMCRKCLWTNHIFPFIRCCGGKWFCLPLVHYF